MARVRATTNSRLSVDDWVQAGFAILAEEGIKALTIHRLCRRLGVTKGGFYWHFTDIAGYRAALVQAWGELRVLMPAVSAAASTINPEFVARLADRAQDAERLRRLPPATIDDLIASGVHRTARARSLRRHTGRLSGHPRSRPPDGAWMRVQRVDDRLLRAAQLDTADLTTASTPPLPCCPPAAMPALGSAERAADIYAERLSQRVLVYEGVMQKDKPNAQPHLAEGARVRLRALRGLLADTVGEIEMIVAAGGHVVFDYDTSRELAAALTPGMKVPRTAMV